MEAATTKTASPRRRRYVLIGLGGIGAQLVRLLVPFVHSRDRQATVVAVDGDSFEQRNRERMTFDELGPKAEILCDELAEHYGDEVNLVPLAEYVTPDNVGEIIEEGDVVFCQPDNHATRRLVEQRCSELDNVALISGGNDGVEEGRTGTYGNVQIYLRVNGADFTNPISRFHPEIAEPGDHLPTDQGCAEAAASAPQLLFTNATVAAAMVNTFYAWREGELEYEELYFDTMTGKMLPTQRKVG